MSECGCKIWHDVNFITREGITFCPLHAHAGELREALENIKKHQEYMAPLVYKLTGAWMIAEAALAKIKADNKRHDPRINATLF